MFDAETPSDFLGHEDVSTNGGSEVHTNTEGAAADEAGSCPPPSTSIKPLSVIDEELAAFESEFLGHGVATPQQVVEEAERFIETLTGAADTRVTFQAFKDYDAASGQPTWFHGTLRERWGKLIALNDRGLGIFVLVNTGDLKGRSKENVVALRAVFTDDDKGNSKEPTSPAPTLVVQSKAGRHRYWLLNPGERVDRFTGAQVQLATHFGTDLKVKDISRVMRLPGFLHQKDPANPFLVTVVDVREGKYGIDDILAAYPAPPPPTPKRRQQRSEGEANPGGTHNTGSADGEQKLRRASAYLAAIPGAISGSGGQNQTFSAAIAMVRGFDMTPDEAFVLLRDEYNARCEPPWADTELQHKVDDADRVEDDRPRGYLMTQGQKSSDAITSPRIVIRTAEHEVVDEAISALAGHPQVFQRGGRLVHVVDNKSAYGGSGGGGGGSSRILQLEGPTIQELMSASADWVAFDGKEYVAAHPPKWAREAVAARGQWKGIRHLRAVTAYPVLRPDGSILSTPGYDEATGLYCSYAGEPLGVARHPTQDDARKAVHELLDVVTDFPFKTPAHRAAWVAALLTPLARHAFSGPAPLFLVDANIRGAGKSMLCDVIGIIVTNQKMARMTNAEDNAEMRKRITAIALQSKPMALLDNVAGMLGGEALDAALTGTEWEDRILGKSELTPTIPLVTSWFATGNNVILNGDTTRRTLHIRMNSPEEKPEERERFVHADLLAWVRAERPRLLRAALTILRGYCATGRPKATLKNWGSYEGWSDVVRQAVAWAGLPDPGLTREPLRNAADTESGALALLIAGLAEMYGENHPFKIRDMLARIGTGDEGSEKIYEAIQELAPPVPGRPGVFSARSVGKKFQTFKERVVGGRALTIGGEDKHDSVQLWTVATVGSP